MKKTETFLRLDDAHYMRLALSLARQAALEGEIPVGAVVVARGRVIGKGYNQTVRLNDPTAHAEMLAMTAAVNHLGSRYLSDCTLYVTLEPCGMCAGASYWAQVGRLVFGASDPKRGYRHFNPAMVHPRTKLTTGVLEQECQQLVVDFFKGLR